MVYGMVYPVECPEKVRDPEKKTGLECLSWAFVIE
jgi:hypothetical protein